MYGVAGVHEDKILTNISVGYKNGDFISEVLFPPLNVKKQSDRYRLYGAENWKAENDLRGPGTVANELPPAVMSETSYYAEEHALQQPITKEERDNNDGYSLDVETTENVTNKILLGREIAAFNIATNTANYATGMFTTLSGTTQFSDYTNSDPRDVITDGAEAIKERIGVAPNTLILGGAVHRQLVNHPKLEGLIKSGIALGNEALMKDVFGVQNLVVPGARTYTGAVSGSPFNNMWNKIALLAYIDKGKDRPTYGREFNWGYPSAMMVDRWNEPQRKSDIIRAQRRYDLKPVGVEITKGHNDFGKIIAGYLILDAVA